jgi:hypothetical protein
LPFTQYDPRPAVRATALVSAVALASLAVAHPALAAPFGAPAPIAGFGASPSSAAFSSAAAGADGTSLLAGARPEADQRQAVVAIGRGGRLPSQAIALGAAGVITAARAIVDDDGHGAVVFARGRTVVLTICTGGTCAQPVTVGTSGVLPAPAVAMQPGTGRVTVLWRGHGKGGVNRLQWRITTGRRLGATHTLGEFGDDPQLGTDASGKTVALWMRHSIRASEPRGLRTAARRVGEFTRPATLQEGRVASPQLATGADGESIAAWLTAGATFDVQTPSGQARVAFRTARSGFSAPVGVGGADTGTLALDRSPDGHAVLALDRQLDATSTVVEAAVRSPGGRFAAPQELAAPQFVSTAFGATAAIDETGVATVAWSSSAVPGAPTPAPAGFFAARSDAAGRFATAAQQLTPDASGGSPQRLALAAAGALTTVAWAPASGPVAAQAHG